MARRFRFTIRTLLAAMLVVAVVCALLTAAHRRFQQAMGRGPLRDPDQWPRALQALIGDDHELRSHVRVYGLDDFIDHRSIWLIKGRSELLDRLLANNAFEAATRSHPMADRLLSSIPHGWPRPDLSASSWQATPGFGQQHIEGVDLFLVVRDEAGDFSVVLHHWNF